jgi:hypothetical protein
MTVSHGAEEPVAGLSRRIAESAPEWFGAGALLASAEPGCTSRPWSFMLRYEVLRADAAPVAVLVKIPREPGIDTLAEAVRAEQWYRATELEHDTLAAVADVFSGSASSGFAWVRPLAYLRPWNALVMEELPSRPLRDLLLDRRVLLGGARAARRCDTVVEAAGRWLRRFHDELGEGELRPVDVPAVRLEVAEQLDRLESVLGARAGVGSLREAFDGALAACEGRTTCVATLHGDCNAVNVIVTADLRVAALDMNEDVRGPVWRDVAGLAADLLTRKALVLPYALLGRRQRLLGWAAAVPRAYAGDEGVDQELLALWTALAVVRKWAQDEQASSGSPVSRLLARRTRRYYRRLATELLRSGTGHVR